MNCIGHSLLVVEGGIEIGRDECWSTLFILLLWLFLVQLGLLLLLGLREHILQQLYIVILLELLELVHFLGHQCRQSAQQNLLLHVSLCAELVDFLYLLLLVLGIMPAHVLVLADLFVLQVVIVLELFPELLLYVVGEVWTDLHLEQLHIVCFVKIAPHHEVHSFVFGIFPVHDLKIIEPFEQHVVEFGIPLDFLIEVQCADNVPHVHMVLVKHFDVAVLELLLAAGLIVLRDRMRLRDVQEQQVGRTGQEVKPERRRLRLLTIGRWFHTQ